jgi:hypothetical protein
VRHGVATHSRVSRSAVPTHFKYRLVEPHSSTSIFDIVQEGNDDVHEPILGGYSGMRWIHTVTALRHGHNLTTAERAQKGLSQFRRRHTQRELQFVPQSRMVAPTIACALDQQWVSPTNPLNRHHRPCLLCCVASGVRGEMRKHTKERRGQRILCQLHKIYAMNIVT